MKVWGLSEAQIRAALKEARLTPWGEGYLGTGGIYEDGRALRVRLCVDRTQPRDENGLLPWQKTGYRGRKTPYVTWEGHREFMRICFRMNGSARIKSAIADYKGRDDFKEKHPSTRGMWNSNEHLTF